MTITVTGIVQIGIVVHSVEDTVKRYQKLLGLTDWSINEVNTEKTKGRNFSNREEPIHAKALIAWTNLGGLELEIIQPQDQNSVYWEFLRDKGPGIHHIMLGTEDTNALSNHLTGQGVQLLASGALQETHFKLFDTQRDLGVFCEIAHGGALIADRKMNNF